MCVQLLDENRKKATCCNNDNVNTNSKNDNGDEDEDDGGGCDGNGDQLQSYRLKCKPSRISFFVLIEIVFSNLEESNPFH